jgi:hypothetical protein
VEALSSLEATPVREEAPRLRGGRRRPAESARAFRNVREELRDLEGVALLLEVLLILSRILSLLGLLTKGARTNLRLSPLQGCLLRSCAQPGDLLTCLEAASQILRNDALLLPCGLHGLLVALLIEGRNSLRRSKTLLARKLRPL